MLHSSPLFQLYLTRLRDFYRQPARIFWVYGFPTLLAIVLGWAFQSRPPAPILVDLVQGSRLLLDQVRARGAQLRDRTREKTVGKAKDGCPRRHDPRGGPGQILKRLNTGTTPLVIEPLGSDSWVYHYDPTRPEAVAARQMIDDILQRAAAAKTRWPRKTRTSRSPAHAISTSSSPD